MANLQYIGARYVPIVYSNPDDGSSNWKAGVAYENLVIVTYYDDSYTSRFPVPATVGNPADNPNYWAKTGDFNAALSVLQQELGIHENRLDDIEQFDSEIFNKVFHIESFRTFKRGHSYPRTSLQGGCYNKNRDEIVCYLDGHLTKMKADGAFIAQTDIAFNSHYNAISYDSKHNKIIIGGGGDPSNQTLGVAIVDYSSLNLIELRTIDGINDYISVTAYDDINNVLYMVDYGGNGYIVDADTYAVVTTFTATRNPADIPAANLLLQGGFCYMGQFYQIIGARGESNRLYCYNINGQLLYSCAYNYTDDREIQFIDSTTNGVIVGYLDNYGGNKMLIFDYQSASVESELKNVYYVDETATDNGWGSNQFPFNDAAFVAHDIAGKSNIIVEIRSDCSKSPILLNSVSNLNWRGHNHLMSNTEYSGRGIYFIGCDGYITQLKASTHLRAERSNMVIDGGEFTITGSSAAFSVANNSHVHFNNCVFNDCVLCVQGTWGGKITAQNITGANNTRFAVLQNASELILNYSTQPAPSDVYFNNGGLAIINGVPSYHS